MDNELKQLREENTNLKNQIEKMKEENNNNFVNKNGSEMNHIKEQINELKIIIGDEIKKRDENNINNKTYKEKYEKEIINIKQEITNSKNENNNMKKEISTLQGKLDGVDNNIKNLIINIKNEIQKEYKSLIKDNTKKLMEQITNLNKLNNDLIKQNTVFINDIKFIKQLNKELNYELIEENNKLKTDIH